MTPTPQETAERTINELKADWLNDREAKIIAKWHFDEIMDSHIKQGAKYNYYAEVKKCIELMCMEKTAMQILREKLETVCKQYLPPAESHYERGYHDALQNVIKDIDTQMLDIERNQHYNTFVAGSERGTGNIPFNAEQYFSQTFSS